MEWIVITTTHTINITSSPPRSQHHVLTTMSSPPPVASPVSPPPLTQHSYTHARKGWGDSHFHVVYKMVSNGQAHIRVFKILRTLQSQVQKCSVSRNVSVPNILSVGISPYQSRNIPAQNIQSVGILQYKIFRQ